MLGYLSEHKGKIKALLMFVSYFPREPVLCKPQSQVQLRRGGFGEKVVDFARCLGFPPLGTAMWWSLSVCSSVHCKLFEWASYVLLKSNWEMTVCKKQIGAFSTHYIYWLGYFFKDSCHLHIFTIYMNPFLSLFGIYGDVKEYQMVFYPSLEGQTLFLFYS